MPKPLLGENDNEMLQTCLPIESFLEFVNSKGKNGTFTDEEDSLNKYLVPSNLIERWGSAMGILEVICFFFNPNFLQICPHSFLLQKLFLKVE